MSDQNYINPSRIRKKKKKALKPRTSENIVDGQSVWISDDTYVRDSISM